MARAHGQRADLQAEVSRPHRERRVAQRFFLRSAIQRQIREFFWSRGFVEVETPTLHNVAGGAAARPFITHMNALDCDFYMRIALELYLKRMLVGGFDRVFEMGRVFRNEGLDRRHNPEFTMLEVYQAYTDHNGMMELIRSLIASICENVLGTTVIKRADGGEIDLGGEWRKATYMDLVREATGAPDWFELSRAEKAKIAAGLGVETDEKRSTTKSPTTCTAGSWSPSLYSRLSSSTCRKSFARLRK